MSRRILVTGARGFLGRAVARRFVDAGWTVSGLGHGAAHEDTELPALAAWHSADVTLDVLATYAGEPDLIVHCAGSGSVPFSVAYPLQDFDRTVSSTAAVLEYVRLHSPQTRVVYPSSAAVYGVVAQLPIVENAPLMPASPYGAHKLMAEQLCRSYAHGFGIAVAVIRFFSIYGEGLRKQLLWDACTRIEKGETGFGGTGAELRDWLHASDAAQLVQIASQHADARCPVVNGASGRALPVKSALRQLFDAWGEGQTPRFSGLARPGDPPGHHADIGLARAWGWAPKVDFADGVARYVRWYRSRAA